MCDPGYVDPNSMTQWDGIPYDDQDNEGDKCREGLNGEYAGAWFDFQNGLAALPHDANGCVQGSGAALLYISYQIRVLEAEKAFWNCRQLLPPE